MTNETNEYTEAYAAALGVATDSNITHDTLVAFRTEINRLRMEIESLRVNTVQLAELAFGGEKFDRWFDDRFGDSLTELVDNQVRETVENVVDEDYINDKVDLSSHEVSDYIDPDYIVSRMLEGSEFSDKVEEIVNDALDSIEVQLVR